MAHYFLRVAFLILTTELWESGGFNIYTTSDYSGVRVKRQTSFICVAPDTCISNGPPPSIDPRIVTPGQTTVPPTTAPCPSGQVPCYATPGAASCGQRYVKDVVTADGPATPGAFPWQAYLTNQTGYSGSGVLVDQFYVITAAHKVYLNKNAEKLVQINIGVSDPAKTLASSQQRNASKIEIHPDFNEKTLKNDIAVIKLDSPIYLGYQKNVAAACMPTAGLSYIGQRCQVSGWGKTAFTSNDQPTTPQKQVTVPIVNYTTCRTSMAASNLLGPYVDMYLDQAGEICAGGEAGKDACTYDGGAPLVCPSNNIYYVAGLVNWGKNCGQANVYGVYVNVPNYVKWVQDTIEKLNKA